MTNRLLSNTTKRRLSAALITAALSPSLWADSPPNITQDIKWTRNGNDIHAPATPPPANYGSVSIIEAAFNNARRQEEIQLGLAAGTITDLDLPSQNAWDGLNDDQKALYILNAERTSRDGMMTDVIGLPFAGVESAVDILSDQYADVLIDNDAVGHNVPSGTAADGIFAKIDDSTTLGSCHTNIARGENLAWYGVTAGNSIPLTIERSIYQWIYDDSSSNWEHREMALLQDQPLNGSGAGFINDDGSNAHEGYIGFSSKGSAAYEPFGAGVTTFSQIVVMQFFDPVAVTTANGCAYAVTETTENLPPPQTNSAPAIVDDTVTTAFNTASAVINVLANDSDPDGDTLSVTANSTPSNGTVVKTGNTFVYTPNSGFTGTDSFDYAASDGTAIIDGTVNVTVGADTSTPAVTPTNDDGDEDSGGGSIGFGIFAMYLLGMSGLIRRKMKETNISQ